MLNTCPRNIFEPICHLDERLISKNYASQLKNITQPTAPSKENEPPKKPIATWVEPPLCHPLPKSASDPPPYCVWTSRNFRNGRGISIIATPEVANTLVSSRWFMDAHLPPSESPLSPPGYQVTPLPGRGLGLIANASYARGDLIMSEVPLLLSSLSLEKSNLTDDEQAHLYRAAVSRLPIKSRKMVMNLHGHPDPKSIRDRFNANAFNVFDFAGMFPAIARTNHDCRPNAAFHFDKNTFMHKIQTVRDIKPGEEITISYLSHYLDSTERTRRMHDHWGFKCTCHLCSSSKYQITASDDRLRRIRRLEILIYQAHSGAGGSTDSVSLAEELISLYREEGLDGALARAYDNLVAAHANRGDANKAKEIARLGVQAANLWPGPTSVEGLRMQKVLEG
ncbi:SET domain-containing protein [Pleomassaria siparia CBS 279.74]|uniref:SET domain-containing protein n=1 Tax=Pleomassaria siparia CBS 279.74 TaxID=1314801 RepID=A0A6G1K6P4_9PLEO|nr:SET domain-containing protein [Pleomassaria siparia CBS 279.74]